MAASSRLLCAWCLVAAAAVACAVPVEAAEALAKVPVTKNSRLGTSIESQQVSAAKKDPAVEVAAAEPVAYRGKTVTEPPTAHHTYHSVADSYTRHDSYSHAQHPHPVTPHPTTLPPYYTEPYPNANSGYAPRGYQMVDGAAANTYPGAATYQPIRGYQPSYANKYPIGSYDAAAQYPSAAPYQQPYAVYSAPFQNPANPYARANPQPKDYYQPAGSVYATDSGYYASKTPQYSVYARDVAKSRQEVDTMYRVTQEGAYPLPAVTTTPPPTVAARHPTVLHLEDTYKQQQQLQQQQVLHNVLANGNALGSSGYGGIYKQNSYASGALSKPAQGADPGSSQWWRDHQHVHDTQAKAGATDKLDALLSIINKVMP